jgi:hypothetical protein
MGLPAVIAASTAVGAVASIQAGQAASASAKYQNTIAQQNAEIYENKATRSEEIGEYNVKRFEKDFTKQIASVERAYAFSGVDVTRGTPLAMMEEYLTEAELEKANITYNAKIEATDYREAAVISRMEGQLATYKGRQAQIGSYFSAGRTLLGGATDIMSVNKYAGMTV